MKRFNAKLLNSWIEQNGKHEAIARLMNKTGLAPATIDKIVRGVYPSEPNFLLRKAFAEVTKIDEGALFPEVAAKGHAS